MEEGEERTEGEKERRGGKGEEEEKEMKRNWRIHLLVSFFKTKFQQAYLKVKPMEVKRV